MKNYSTRKQQHMGFEKVAKFGADPLLLWMLVCFSVLPWVAAPHVAICLLVLLKEGSFYDAWIQWYHIHLCLSILGNHFLAAVVIHCRYHTPSILSSEVPWVTTRRLFVHIITFIPKGPGGVTSFWKGTAKYSQVEIVLLNVDWQRKFNVNSVCTRRRSHRNWGKSGDTPNRNIRNVPWKYGLLVLLHLFCEYQEVPVGNPRPVYL